jgi:hypothetical protein
MSPLNPVCLLAAGLLLACVTPGISAADDSEQGQVISRPAPFSTQLKREETSGPDIVQRAYIACGTNRFAFVVPPEYRLDGSNPEKIVLSNADYSSFISFRIVAPLNFPAQALEPEKCRQRMLECYPGAKVLEEFSQSAANHSGPAFDVRWTNSSNAVQFARVAFIPSPAGVLEFSLVATDGNFKQGEYFLNSVMLTFRSNEGGKLDIAPLSDKF